MDQDKYGVWSVTVSDGTRVSVARAIGQSIRESGRQCDTVSVAPLQRLVAPTQQQNSQSPSLAVALEEGGNHAYIASSEGIDFDIVSIVSEALREVGHGEVVLLSEESFNREVERLSQSTNHSLDQTAVAAAESNVIVEEKLMTRDVLCTSLMVAVKQKEIVLSAEQGDQIAVLKSSPLQGELMTFSEAISPLTFILSDEQLRTIKRNVFYGLGVRAFAVPEVQEALKLTDEQKGAVAAIRANLKKELRPFQDKVARGEAVDFIALDRDMKPIHDKAYKEALDLLTAEQRQTWAATAKPGP